MQLVELTSADADEMVAITDLTEPGPFLRRTIEIGGYVGLRRDGQLVAMAGQHLRGEVSAVCTHPSAQRLGLGAYATLKVAEAIRARGGEAVLHVRETNETAHRLHQRIGFRADGEFHVTALIQP
ncbi:MAG: putative GNAT family acetyltransferase [Candidatus Poriferisodalaceae bacterium]|jgi:predicted GNAT family acetyltransferase